MKVFLNPLNIDVATLGNHDFDFGLDAAIELTSACNFPWMMANVEDSQGNTIANGLFFVTISLTTNLSKQSVLKSFFTYCDIEEIVTIHLNDNEKGLFAKSADAVRAMNADLKSVLS